ncbi:hypothetical protein Taro_018652, partial [Colocasia esculenta]|nr:hypothetical protein [Colocasia esculenta]
RAFRCAAVYDNRSSPASVLTARVARSLKDLCSLVNPKRILSAQQKQILPSLHIVDYTQHSTPRLVKWLRPPAGLKLNTDGCSRGNPGSSAGAGVIRNSSGDFVLAYSNFDGLSSSLLAEFRAIIDVAGKLSRGFFLDGSLNASATRPEPESSTPLVENSWS